MNGAPGPGQGAGQVDHGQAGADQQDVTVDLGQSVERTRSPRVGDETEVSAAGRPVPRRRPGGRSESEHDRVDVAGGVLADRTRQRRPEGTRPVAAR